MLEKIHVIIYTENYIDSIKNPQIRYDLMGRNEIYCTPI